MTRGKPSAVLVLGKNGMLGQAVYGRLAACEGLVVDGTQRSDGAKPMYFDACQGADAIKEILSGKGYRHIINCIGVLKPSINERDSASLQTAIKVNALFPHLLASAAAQIQAQVIHISTDGVFSGSSPRPYLETSPLDCTDHYGKTKALGECPAPNVLNIRCSIIGQDPAGKKGLFEWFLGLAGGQTVTGYEDCRWNGVTTAQFARLCEAIIKEDRFGQLRTGSQVYHFCPNPSVSKYELLCLFKDVTGKRVDVLKGSAGKAAGSRILGSSFEALDFFYKEDVRWADVLREMMDDGGSVNKTGQGRGTT